MKNKRISLVKRAKTHGFRHRQSSKKGRQILSRRRHAGRRSNIGRHAA